MSREQQYYVYILTNVARNVMYVGVTNNLENRVAQHRESKTDGFTKRYKVNTLVYAEDYQYVEDALVESANPTWADLLETHVLKDPSLRSG